LGLTDLEGLFVLAVLGCFIGLGLEMFAGWVGKSEGKW
jgi:hypothetical protein